MSSSALHFVPTGSSGGEDRLGCRGWGGDQEGRSDK